MARVGGVFKKLLLSNLGSRQSMAQTDLCYSCRDNSFKGNADGERWSDSEAEGISMELGD